MISIPKDSTIPDYPQNLALYASFEQVMFVFDAGEELDLSYYQYELYNSSAVSGTYPNYSITESPVVEGNSASNVFTVSVTNSTKNDAGSVVNRSYRGRVRSVDTSGNISLWSPIVLTDQSTPLIDSQYINTLTASKITAGTISSAEIIMSGANSIIKSSTFNGTAVGDGSYTGATAGWLINGTGKAYFYDATIVGKIDIGGFDSGSFHVDTDGNMWMGAGTYAAAPFKVSSEGAVTSVSGLIGGFSISSDKLTAGSGSEQITLSTGVYHATNNPDEIVISVGGNLSSGFGAPFAVNSAGTMSAAVATVGPLQLDANGLTSYYYDTSNYITLDSDGDFWKFTNVGSDYYVTYMFGELLQIRKTNSLGAVLANSPGAFLGFYNAGATVNPLLVVNQTTPQSSGQYVQLTGNTGEVIATGTIYGAAFSTSGTVSGGAFSTSGTTSTRYLNVATNGSIDFNSQVRQMINLWSTSYGIGVQSSTQYFRSGQNFAWYTGGSHADGALDAGGGTRRMYLSNGDLVVGSSITLGSHTMTSDTWRFIINPNNYSNLQIGIGEYYAGAGVYASGSDLSLIGSGAVRFKTGGSNSQWGVISPSGFDIWSGIIVSSTNFDGTWRNEGNGYYKLAQNPWSTRRVKVDIQEVGEQLNPNKLLDIPIVQFKYMEGYLAEGDPIYNTDICGLLAEEVFEHYPTVVRLDSETWEPQSINYQLMIPPLLGLIQNLSKRIDELESKI